MVLVVVEVDGSPVVVVLQGHGLGVVVVAGLPVVLVVELVLEVVVVAVEQLSSPVPSDQALFSALHTQRQVPEQGDGVGRFGSAVVVVVVETVGNPGAIHIV